MGKRMSFKKRLEDAFSWDVSALGAYTDEQSDQIEQDIIFNSDFISKVTIHEDVKGDSKEVKTMLGDLSLQEVTACTMSDDGSISFDGVTLNAKTVGVQMGLCNQTLEGTWAEMLKAVGANRANREMPLEDVITAYVVKQQKKKVQDLVLKGDTTSGDTELNIMDGLIKLWKNDPLINAYSGSLPVSVTNAFDNFLGVFGQIPYEVLQEAAALDLEIMCSYADARLCIENIYNDKDYSANLDVSYEGGGISFILPTTNIRVRSYPQLATGEIYAVPMRFVHFGTELNSDFENFSIRYIESDEKLRASNKMKVAINYIFPAYFAKLDEAAS